MDYDAAWCEAFRAVRDELLGVLPAVDRDAYQAAKVDYIEALHAQAEAWQVGQ